MIDIIEKQLVVRISGEVQQSNLAEFEMVARKALAGINTNLQTDEDFAIAERDVKDCELVETRLQQAKADALNNTKEVSELIMTIDRLTSDFRSVRLKLSNAVKTEKEARKNEIVNEGRSAIVELMESSPVAHGFLVDHKAIIESAKGKRSLAKIKEAVVAVVESETARLAEMEKLFYANMVLIRDAEREWPGLFPDHRTLALSSTDTVESQIEGRIAKHQLELRQKAEREAEAKKRADEAAERAQETITKPKQEEQKTKEPEPFEAKPSVQIITVQVAGTRDKAIEIARAIDMAVKCFSEVQAIRIV